MADRNGYIGRAPGDSAVVIARQSFEPSGIQTNFTFSSGYTVGYIDVYYNGVKLIDVSDYTASSGNTVVLVSAAGADDVLPRTRLVIFPADDPGVNVKVDPSKVRFASPFKVFAVPEPVIILLSALLFNVVDVTLLNCYPSP